MRKPLFILALSGLLLPISSCANGENQSTSKESGNTIWPVSSEDAKPSSESVSSSNEKVTRVATIEFGDLEDLSISGTPDSSSYKVDGIHVSNVAFGSCFGDTRKESSANSHALRMGSGKKIGSLTISFSSPYCVKEAYVYASKYEVDSSVNYNFSSSVNPNGMDIVIDSTTSAKFTYLNLDNGKGDLSTDVTFGAKAKGRIFVHKIELLIEENGSGSSSSSQSSASSEQSSVSSESHSSESSSSSSKGEPDIDPSGYYKGIDWNATGATLKTALSKVISNGAKAIGYDNLWNAYKTTDVREDGTVWDMYSNVHFNFSQKAGNYSKEGDCYNREHTIPQSSFKSTSGNAYMKCDLFNVVPTDGYVNNRRSNFPHGNVSSATYTSGNGSKLGTGNNNGYNGTVFEVVDEYKGDFARAYFFFVTRYQNYIPSMNDYAPFVKNTYPSLAPWAIKTYLAWNDMDPVSEKEIKRNDEVYKIQNNRNPFIDHPEAVHKIWG